MTETSTQERATAAAEALSAEGTPVTARTVQQRARVSMSVAAAVAREWNAKEAAARAIPEVPAQVLARVDAIWREAVEAARTEHDTEREGWAARIAAGEEERAGLTEELERIEAEHSEEHAAAQAAADELHARIAAHEADAAEHAAAATSAAAAVAAAEARASAAEGVAAGLREALSALTAK